MLATLKIKGRQGMGTAKTDFVSPNPILDKSGTKNFKISFALQAAALKGSCAQVSLYQPQLWFKHNVHNIAYIRARAYFVRFRQTPKP